MRIHSDELIGTPTISRPILESERLAVEHLEEMEALLDHLDHTIEHAWEATREVEQFESGIVDIAPVNDVDQAAFRW
jgi:hypothetical protein